MVTKQVSASEFDYSFCYGINSSRPVCIVHALDTMAIVTNICMFQSTLNKWFHVFISSTHIFIKQYELQLKMFAFYFNNYVV